MPRLRGHQPKPLREEQFFEVEALIAKRSVKGETEYLVKWRGFSDDHATWENAVNLTNIMDMILEFECGNQQESSTEIDNQITAAKKHSTQFGSQDHSQLPQPIYLSLKNPHDQTSENPFEEVEMKALTEEEQLQSAESGDEGLTKIAATNIQSNKQASNSLAGSKAESKPCGSTGMDISFQARQLQTRFEKITDKYKGRNSKRYQKEMKKERKNAIKQQTAPAKTRGRKKKEYMPVTQMLEQIEEKCETEGTSNEQGGIRNRLRPQSASPLARPKSTKEKVSKNEQSEGKFCKKSKRSKEKEETRKVDQENESFGLEFEGPKYQALQHQIVRDICNAVELAEEKYQHVPIKIRRLENIPNEPAEYILEYGSGVLRRFKILELMKTYPLEFASYLEARHSI